jgi:hypothetical protein
MEVFLKQNIIPCYCPRISCFNFLKKGQKWNSINFSTSLSHRCNLVCIDWTALQFHLVLSLFKPCFYSLYVLIVKRDYFILSFHIVWKIFCPYFILLSPPSLYLKYNILEKEMGLSEFSLNPGMLFANVGNKFVEIKTINMQKRRIINFLVCWK